MVLLVLAVLATLVVRLTSVPIIYWSDRIGQYNKIFKIPKFRTMKFGPPVVAAHLLNDTEQLRTPVGSFLRKTSLDELPIPIKVGLDIEYMKRQSHCFDMCILWLTFLKAIRVDGVSH